MAGRLEACLNCQTPLEDIWCPHCGQRNWHERLNPNELAHDAFDQIVGIDTKIGRTLVDFTRDPGGSALAYVEGHRARYINPLKYMIFAVAVYFLYMALLGIRVSDFGPQQEVPVGADPILHELTLAHQVIVNEGMRTIIFCSAPIFAWVTGFLLGRRRFRIGRDGGFFAWIGDLLTAPRRFNFAETCSLWLHVFAQTIFIVTLPALTLQALGWNSAMMWAIAPTVFVYTWAAKGFFGRGWIYTFLVVVLSYFAFMAVLMGTLVACVIAAMVWSG